MRLLFDVAGVVLIALIVPIGALLIYAALNARRAQHQVPREGAFVDVEGARLHYVERGRGRPIVLIHGLGCNLNTLTYALAERLADDFRVIAVDRPGAGYSVMTKDAVATLHGQAAIFGRFLRAVDAEGALIVGHSLGGALALTLAVDEPDLIGGLALVAPLSQPIEEMTPAFKPLLIPSPFKRRLISWTLAPPLARINRAKALRVIFGPDPVVPDFETRGGAALGRRPSAIYAASSEVSLGTGELVDLVRRYPALRPPLGILYGRDDRILSAALHGERTATQVPGAAFETIAGGHMIPLTAPDATAAFVRRQAARLWGA